MHVCMYDYIFGIIFTFCTSYRVRSMYVCMYVRRMYEPSILQCTSDPLCQSDTKKQATTASHTKCYKLGAGCCLDFSPDKEGGFFFFFFATSKAPEKAKKGRIYGYTVHTYTYSVHVHSSLHTEYILLAVAHIRTPLSPHRPSPMAHRLEPTGEYSLSVITCSVHTYVTSCSCQNRKRMELHH